MLIKIKLDDKRFCDSCPCLNTGTEFNDYCNLEYWETEKDISVWVNKKTGEIQKKRPRECCFYELRLVRPKECIKERGN